MPDKNDPNVIYFEAGIHEPTDTAGKCFRIPSNTTVYLEGGAVLKGCLTCDSVENVKILGHGMLLEPQQGISVTYSRNVLIDGVTVVNPRHYTVSGGQSTGITIKNLKSFSYQGWSDGLDFMSCSDVMIDDVFLRNSDDCIALYTHRWNYYGDCRNVHVLNSTLWADIAHPINIGTHGNTETGDEVLDRVATILNIALQLVANLAIAFEPFLPFSSEKLRQMLNMETFEWDQLGRTDLLAEGHQLNKAELLFEKIEDETIQAQVDKLLATKKANEAANYKANPIKPVIAFEEFEKLDIRVGTVLECEVVPKMKKLLKFKIADGLENRTIVSGIAQHYKPEELVGKQVLFIANLAPRQFKNGLVSEGMILSAENFDGTLAVTSLLREVKPGSEVK